jgi:hemerythrin-like metal-binding protein
MYINSALIQWKDSFNTGYQRVDNQHKELVKLINELYDIQNKDGTNDSLRRVFKKLFDYTVNHFSMEEKLMKEYDYDNYIDHKEEHMKFITKIHELKEEFLTGNSMVQLNILNFLKEWLLTHIIGTDKVTFIQINKKIFPEKYL